MNASYAPLRVSLAWLLGTFLLFLFVGETSRVPDMLQLVSFIAASVATFVLGYWLKVKTWRRPPTPQVDDAASIRRWVVLSGAYTLVFGLVLLRAYGATGAGAVLDAVQHPGSAYFFRLRDARVSEGNAAVQILTIGAALTTPVVPFTIVFWDRLTPALRVLVFAGVLSYCSYWAFIGTQKGVGDFASFAVVAILARVAISGRGLGRRAVVGISVLGVLFGLYMVFNQSDRLSAADTTGGIEANPIASSLFGDEIGRGVTTSLGYPTHGYLGLAYNLGTPVEWTHFRGSSRALDSYWTQYVDRQAEPIFPSTLPARTQQRTGWPALSKWCTIYPWLASDLSWPGAVAFMGVVGWWTARWWLEAIYLRRKLALLLVGQMAILIAYVPANNQIGITRPGLIAFMSLLGLYFVSQIGDALARRVQVRNPDLDATLERRRRSGDGGGNGEVVRV